MADTLNREYESIYQMNLNLLKMAREGEWDGFIELAEGYIISLRTALDKDLAILDQHEHRGIVEIIKTLVSNETEMTRLLQSRLDVLQLDISTLSQGKKCNVAYSSSFTSIF